MKSSLSHVALLVPSVERAAGVLNSLGIETCAPEEFESEGTKEIYVGSYEKQAGLLLLVEATGNGPYARALEKRGPSLHHIAVDTLDLDLFLRVAEQAGWSRHSVSAETMCYGTAWLYAKGIPTLIEIHQKKVLSSQPLQISKVELPISPDMLNLFYAIGLSELVTCSPAGVRLTIDGHPLSFDEIALGSQRD